MSVKEVPDEVWAAWEQRSGPLVVTTAGDNGIPNSIYASIVNRTGDGRIAVADNYFNKTAANIRERKYAVVLFLTESGISYQIKGTVEYYTEGPRYREMLAWAKPEHPRKGVLLVNAEQVFRGGERLV